MYAAGLRLLSNLQNFDECNREASLELVVCLSSFTHAEDPWTNQASHSEASDLLKDYIKTLTSEPGKVQTLLTDLLREIVKPAFAKSKSSAITPAGRKAISALAPTFEPSIDETTIKPWKYGQIYIVTVLEWTLSHLDVRLHISNVFSTSC